MVVHPLHNKAQAYRLVCPICLECSNNCCRCSLCQEFYHVKQHQPYAGMHSCFFFLCCFWCIDLTYQAIEAAIELNLNTVEAGAQGEHKIQRGYLPVTTYSCHYFMDEGFRKAIEDFLVRESSQVIQHYIAVL